MVQYMCILDALLVKLTTAVYYVDATGIKYDVTTLNLGNAFSYVLLGQDGSLTMMCGPRRRRSGALSMVQ